MLHNRSLPPSRSRPQAKTVAGFRCGPAGPVLWQLSRIGPIRSASSGQNQCGDKPAECQNNADKATDPEAKATWLKLTKEWRKLGDRTQAALEALHYDDTKKS